MYNFIFASESKPTAIGTQGKSAILKPKKGFGWLFNLCVKMCTEKEPAKNYFA